ncbi:glycosyltransferase, partial [Streptococcus pyogenes]|uniref:glycosyltransferase n=1 Tax=Streptococcus pyogenes TaxID=1314 RepID=UPI003D9FD110
FRRAANLLKLLRSIEAVRVPEHCELRVLIVDNDSNRSAEAVVRRFAQSARFPVSYEVEPKQGISFARNRLLHLVSGDYALFIDDDETASPDWLINLLEVQRKHDADVVFGPVVSIFEEPAPEWIVRHPIFRRIQRESGTLLPHGASNNVLLRSSTTLDRGISFDGAFAKTGGEDTHFFYQLRESGAKLVWCDTAEVFEHVPHSRARLSWMLRRSFRGGQSFARLLYTKNGWCKRKSWMTWKFAQALLGCLCLPLAFLVSPHVAAALLTKVCAALGQATACLSSRFLYAEYGGKGYEVGAGGPS